MDYNNIIIFLIFCLTLSVIYTGYIKFENKYSIQDKVKKNKIDNFFIDDLEIKKYSKNNRSDLINELIVKKEEINNNFNYLTIPIETETEVPIKLGKELIKKKEESNLSQLDSIYNNEFDSAFIYEKYKKQSTDLPIVNLHCRFLLNNDTNNDIRLSNLLNS
tara:strand:- start:7481 stop:7966 length:486 start_codon:yes stop_codon:yes gene_type:complete